MRDMEAKTHTRPSAQAFQSRRRLLQLGGVSIAASLPLAATAAAETTISAGDQELAGIGRRLDVLLPALEVAWDERVMCQERAELYEPEVPDALLKRDSDGGWGGAGRYTGGDWYGQRDVERALALLPVLDAHAAAGSELARTTAARAREVIAAHEEWDRLRDAHNIACGLDAANDRVIELQSAIRSQVSRALELRATTRAGFLVKARIVQWHGPTPDEINSDDMEWSAFASLLADLRAEG